MQGLHISGQGNMKLLELCALKTNLLLKKLIIGRERMQDYLEYDRCFFLTIKTLTEGVHGIKPLTDFWKILRQPGLKYLPAIFTVYSGLA